MKGWAKRREKAANHFFKANLVYHRVRRKTLPLRNAIIINFIYQKKYKKYCILTYRYY